MSGRGGWIAFDLDGTLAAYHGWKGVDHVGEPIRPMVERLRAYRAEGWEVRILTARVADPAEAEVAQAVIERWCLRHVGEALPVTCVKDRGLVRLYDDRAVEVGFNTGRLVRDFPVFGSV